MPGAGAAARGVAFHGAFNTGCRRRRITAETGAIGPEAKGPMSTSARIKRQLAVSGRALGAVVVVLGIAAIAAGGYVYTTPPTEEVPSQRIDVQEFETEIEHSADIVEPTPLYRPPGTVRNQPVYFLNGTPELRITVNATVPDDRAVTVQHNLTVYREATFRETTFFEEETTRINRTETTEDGLVQAQTTLDIPAVAERTAEVRNAITGTGTVTTGIRLRTSYEAPSTEGGTYQGTLTTESEFELTERAYWLASSDLAASQTESRTTEPRVNEQSPNVPVVVALVVAGLGAVAGGVRLASWSRTVDVEALETEVHRSQYDEWISEGDFPTDAGKQYVYINSLEDLVDIAIDTGKRVIYDDELDTYGVLDGDMVYYHATDATTIDSWVNFRTNDG